MGRKVYKMVSRFISSADGTRLFYKAEQAQEARAVVVVVHGLCEHQGRYDYLAERLHSCGYSVARFDHRGHGQSEGTRVFYNDTSEILGDVDAAVETARTENPGVPLFVIGHSMGGFAAALYGSTYPGKAAGYVLSGALTRNTGNIAEDLPRVLPRDTYFPNTLGAGVCSDPKVVEAYGNDPLVEKMISAGLFYTLFSGIDWLKENPRSFTDPVLLLHGCDDGLVNNQDSRDFFGEIASEDKTLKIYSRLYHEIFNEVTRDEVIDDAIAWLDRHVIRG
jgi:lysophospholipase